jgi:hypothetical protein
MNMQHYTNLMARKKLRYAIETLKTLKESRFEVLQGLTAEDQPGANGGGDVGTGG